MNTKVIQIYTGNFTNAFLILGGGGSILVDTGYPDSTEAILGALHQHGVTPGDVRLILLTHGHIDHFGSAAELRERTGAPIAIHALDAEAVRQGINLSDKLKPTSWTAAIMSRGSGLLGPSRIPGFDPDIIFRDERRLDEYGIAGRIIHTPGHTPGSISVLLDSGEAIIGDLVMGDFLRLSRKPQKPIVACDMERNWESVRRLGALSPCMIFVGHGGPFSDLSGLAKS